MEIKLTVKEKLAIAALKRIEKKWPESLWLFSASGSLCIMKCDENGERVYTPSGGTDQRYTVEHVNIPNDGGDW